jgi:hypothetical protein
MTDSPGGGSPRFAISTTEAKQVARTIVFAGIAAMATTALTYVPKIELQQPWGGLLTGLLTVGLTWAVKFCSDTRNIKPL